MTEKEIYRALIRGGRFALPYLVTLCHETAGAVHLVNNNEDVTYNGITYKASSFEYQRPSFVGGVLDGGMLSVTGIDTDVINFFENADETFLFYAVGVLVDGEVVPLKQYKQMYAEVSIDSSLAVTVEFSGDDRMDMVFPPYVFDADNNRGNA